MDFEVEKVCQNPCPCFRIQINTGLNLGKKFTKTVYTVYRAGLFFFVVLRKKKEDLNHKEVHQGLDLCEGIKIIRRVASSSSFG